MSPPGGGIKPTSGQQIVQEMFEGDKPKQTDAAQRSSQLQEQARTQQALQRGGREGGPQESEEGRGERTEGQRGQPARTGKRGPLVSKEDRAMDGFLSRNSTQQKTREAGRELNQDRRTRSHNPQSWGVYSSRQTSPRARRMILARNAQQNAARSNLNRPNATGRALPQTPTPSRGLPQGTPSAMPLNIHYTRTPQQGTEPGPRRPFSQRFDASQNLRQQIARLVVSRQGAGLAQSGKNQTNVMVHLRGNLVFVRDQGKTRAFKLNKDGSLSELPSEDSSDQPLSSEAKAQLKKVLRQRGLRSGADGKQSNLAGEISEAELAEIIAEQEAAESGEGKPLDFETQFALLLYEALEENKKLGKKLGEGELPSFPTKKDWEAFFAKLARTGNKEKSGSKSLDEILSMMFRGLFNKKGKGKYLVGDLAYSKSGKNRQEKFAQVAVNNEDFLKFLSQLKPGQSISAKELAKAFGEELTYLMMAHVGEEVFNMATGAEKNVLFNPKAAYDPYSQARFEQSLMSSRKKSGGPDPDGGGKQSIPGPDPTGVFANVYELLGLRKTYEGQPKTYTAIAYLAMTLAAGLGITFLILKFL